MKVKFSFRYKFLAVVALLLGGCLVAYSFLAVRIFQRDKTELVYDLNRSAVATVAAELETRFRGLSNKVELFSALALGGGGIPDAFAEMLTRDPDLVYVAVKDTDERAGLASYANPVFLETYGITEKYFEKTLPSEKPVPLEAIQKNGEWIWNASTPNGPLLLGLGKSVITENAKGRSQQVSTVVAYLKPDNMLRELSQAQMSQLFVTDAKGGLLLHSQPEKLRGEGNWSNNPLYAKASGETLGASVVALEIDQQQVLAAFQKSYGNQIFVFGQTQADRAFSAVAKLVQRSLQFGLFVVTLSLFVALLFSRSLVRPLTHLTQGMEQVAGGALDTHIVVRTHDELAVLAESFNSMIRDLKKSRALLEEANRDLEKKVADRTRELEEQNRAVQSAQEALLRTTRLASVGEIAGRTAHEILNPLTSILTRLEKMANSASQTVTQELQVLREIREAWQEEFHSGGMSGLLKAWEMPSSVLDGKTLWDEDLQNLEKVGQSLASKSDGVQKDLRFLLEESQRISRIVGRMRSLTQPVSHPVILPLAPLLRESVKIMGDLFYRNQVEVKEEFFADELRVRVDRDEFLQTMTNLLRNSLQALASRENPSMPAAITLRTGRSEHEVWIEVEDNGPGISFENQGQLFETQFTTKSREEGTGLGLSICRRFMRAVNGDLKLVRSAPQKGTCFQIRLPVPETAQRAGVAS